MTDDPTPDHTSDPTPSPSAVARAKAKSQVWAESARTRSTDAAHRANAWVEETTERQVIRDLAIEFRDRDRDAFASVLGSAIALRLFLFTTSVVVALVSLLNLVAGSAMHNALKTAGVTGTLASQVESAAQASGGRHLGLLATGLFLAFTSGRSLTKVLAACSAGAWRVDARTAKATVRVAARVTIFLALLIIAASGLNRLRTNYGVAVATGSLATNALVMGTGWFFVTLALPKQTRDPGAMLPGAALFGVTITGVQWFMQFYLPRKIANASEVMGSIGFAVATLGYLFLIGRIMAGCIVCNAVLWERFGSISEFVFGLPVLRRIPARSPRIARFFDLEHDHAQAPEGAKPPPEA